MALAVYKSPKDLPLKYPLKSVVEIIKPDMHFEKKYGSHSSILEKCPTNKESISNRVTGRTQIIAVDRPASHF
jgi:hypothetical protein